MTPQAQHHRDKATELLVHYFRLVKPDLDSDNRMELEQLVDHLIAAAVIEATDSPTTSAGPSLNASP